MADTPDISKIVSLIMENPGIVSEIAEMAKSSTKEGSDELIVQSEAKEPITEQASAVPREDPKRVHRMRLAAAMKPYLSEHRAQAIDAMMSIVDILEVVRGK